MMKAGAALALLLPALPSLAASADDEALARDLLVCGGKFGGLAIMTGEHRPEVAAFYFYATKLAGPDFVKRKMEEATSEAADWLFAKDDPKPTLDAARATCAPILKKADALIASKPPDAAHPR